MDNNEEMITPELINNNAIKQAEINAANVVNSNAVPSQNDTSSTIPQPSNVNTANSQQNVTTEEPKRYIDMAQNKPKFDPINNSNENADVEKNQSKETEAPRSYVLNHANSSSNNGSEDNSSYTQPVRMKDYMASAAFNNGAEKTNENIKTKNVKMGPLSIPISAYVFFLAAIVHYFLMAPFIGKYLLKHSLYEALNVISNYFNGSSSQISTTLLYLFTFLFIMYSIVSFLLVVYGLVNIIKKGENILKFASHIKKIIGFSILASIVVIIIFRFSDFDILTPLFRVVTLNGLQYKIVGFTIGL